MLLPKKMKHRKQQRGKLPGNATRGFEINFGSYGLKALERGWVTAREIEAARRAMTRYIHRGGQIWIKIFPDKPVTITSAETPMGSGKGTVDHFVSRVVPGTILFEIDGVSGAVAKEAMRLAAYKLRVKTKFLEKE